MGGLTVRERLARQASAPARSPRLFGLFRWYSRSYVARHFHAVRLSRTGFKPGLNDALTGPLVVVVNHPSWWDPLVGMVLADLWPGRAHFAPIDSAGLARYRFLERLGFFGIEPGTTRGALAFLRQGLAALGEPGGMLWVTSQGRFTDPRSRPTRLKGGVGHLLHRLGTGNVVPLALEYPFRGERTPEALARFGPPISVDPRRSPSEWTSVLEIALESAQDALAADALARDPARFETLLAGSAGVGGVYDAWRRLKAAARGERFVAGHGEEIEESLTAEDADKF